MTRIEILRCAQNDNKMAYVPANIYLPIRHLYAPHRREIYDAIQHEKGEK
ncbi:MAG: hypothetical protein ACYSU4_04905 [Planctomycetota bacterium]|jgi:hypothetical protein